MTKVEGKSGPNIQQADTSIQNTDQRMQQILSGPGNEKEKVAKLENELKGLMESKPKTEKEKQDLEAEKRQIQNQLQDPKSAFGKLSPASRHKLEAYFSSKAGSVDSSGKQREMDKALKEGASDRQRMRGAEERKVQEAFLKFTPQYYEEKIKSLKKEIEETWKEFDRNRGRGNLEDPRIVQTQWGPMTTTEPTDAAYVAKLHKTLEEKKRELEKVEAEYRQKFPLRPSGPMHQQ